MDKDTIKGILAKYSPPLSPGQMDEIAEAILKVEEEEPSALAKFAAELSGSESKRPKSKSPAVTGRRGRTQ